MSNLKLRSNLFLGTHELNFLKDSMKDSGFVRLFQNAVVSYGVVNRPTDTEFTNLHVFRSSVNKIGVRAGNAIDSNLNVISINEDLIDNFVIQPDSVLRYVVIKHEFTTIEKGTVSIQADGSIVGTGTEFTKRLRGLPDFPTRITFESNLNNQEYIINAVQSDTLAGVNVALTDIFPEDDVNYRVVGTFTPSTTIPEENKYPFESDGYVLELRDSGVLAENEYLLAEVIFNGSIMEIFDKRRNNQFSLIDESGDPITDNNTVVGVEQIMYDSARSTMHENLVKIGWGIESDSSDWVINPATQELLINKGQGGAWGSLSPFSDGDFDNWYVVFERTGQVLRVENSTKAGSSISLLLEFSNSYPLDGNISVVPNSDHVELTVLNVGSPTADKKLTFAAISRYAIVPIQAGSESIIQYKHLSRDQVSLGRTINNGSYIQEPSFDESGQQVSQGVKNYFDGRITPLLSVTNLFDRLTCGFIRMWSGSVESIPSGYFLCDGQNGTIDLRGRFVVGHDPNNEKFSEVGQTGGTEDEFLEINHLPAHGHTGTAKGGDHGHDYRDRFFPESRITQTLAPPFGVETQQGGLQGSGNDDEDNTLIIYKDDTTQKSGDLIMDFDSNTTGNDEAHNNLPPYYTLCFITRPCAAESSNNEVQGNILDLNTLRHYKNDADAGNGGILVGQFYLADRVNTLGLSFGTVKRRES